MEARLQKYGFFINLGAIAIAAMILAFAASEVFAVFLAPYGVPEVVVDARAVKKAEQRPKRSRTRSKNLSRAIIERCLFGCPEKEAPAACPEPCEPGEVCQDGTCVAIAPQEQSPDGLPVASDMDVKLLGAMVAKNPEYSVALIQDPSAKTTYVAGVGEFIGPDAEVLEIYRDRVIIRRKGRLEFIKLDASLMGNPTAGRTLASGAPPNVDLLRGTLQGKTPGADDSARIAPDPVAAREKAVKERSEGVQKVGENTYEIDRDAIEEQLDDPKKLAKQARIIPNYKDGKRDGIKLVGVTPSGVFGKIGIQSGDIVRSINGEKVTSQNKAFELLDSLRKAQSVKIEIERRGKSQTIQYSIK